MQIVAVRTADEKSNFTEILKRCFVANCDRQKKQEELGSEADELARSLLEDESTSTIKQLEGYLLSQRPCAQCAVIEENYIDRDFLDDYVSYHYRCFESQSQKCCRVHFFSVNFTGSQVLENLILAPDEKIPAELLGEGIGLPEKDVFLKDVYLGFFIVRPLRKTIVGRTCLALYPQEHPEGAALPGRHYPAVCKNHVSFFGVDLALECMPFQEQDGATAACATCVLWSAFSVSAHLFGNRIPSPSAITALAVENSFSSNRKFPNHGLSVEEMSYAIRKTGLDPIVIRLDRYPTGMERAHMFLGAMYAYLNLGVSVIAVLDAQVETGETIGVHAIAINGYHLPEKNSDSKGDARKWLSAMSIDKFYANDDQCCPGARFIPEMGISGTDLEIHAYRGPFSEESKPYRTYVPRSLIIPLYNKIHVTFEEVANEVAICVGALNEALQRMLKDDPNLPETTLQLDITLCASNDFKANLRKDGSLPKDTILQGVETSFPRFVWCVRIDCNEKKAAVMLIDTTDSEQGLNVIGVFLYECDLDDENAIRRMARYAFYQRCRRDFNSERRRVIEQQGLLKALCLYENSKKEFDYLSEQMENSPMACFQLGWMYEQGEGVKINKQAAINCYEKAARGGNRDALFNLGWIYEHGDGVTIDKDKALEWYAQAAKHCDDGAKYRMAKIYDERGDVSNARRLFEEAAKEGYVNAQYALAELHDDPSCLFMPCQAKEWYMKAAKHGHKGAQFMLGKMYRLGLWGEAQTPVMAANWLRMAAQQGHADAQYELAKMYEEGSAGVPKDDLQAILWYTKAAEQGHKNAQYNLGLLHEQKSDIYRAIMWYAAAAERKEGEEQKQSTERIRNAQYKLGQIYELGKSGTIDISMAVRLYAKSAAQGSQMAKEALKTLSSLGSTVAQKVIEAQRGAGYERMKGF